jgi:hypothetical protein
MSAPPETISRLSCDAVPRRRLSDAQIARTVASVAPEAVLCTQLMIEGEGASASTFTSPAPFVVDETGCPLVPLYSAEAARNLQACEHISFYARAPRGGAAGASVVTLIGSIDANAPSEEVLGDDQLKAVSQTTGETAEALAARQWVRVVPERVHVFDAVRNVEAWVAASDYADAQPNPLARAATTLLSKINDQHAPALRRFAAIYAGVPLGDLVSAELLSVDQSGFDMRIQMGEEAPPSLVRAGFAQGPTNEEEATSLFMKLFQEAYERQNGFM